MLIASSTDFADANYGGLAYDASASNVGGVRPLLKRYQMTICRISEQGMSVHPSGEVN